MTQHTRKSLLAGTSWKTESDSRRAASLAEAEQNRNQAMTDLVVTIDDMSEAIAEQHPKPVDALSAESAFLNQLRDTLVVSGDRITAFFANGYQPAGVDQTQVHELSSRNQELEQELAAVQGNQDDLQRSAQRASDLQIQVNELEREQSRLQTEVATLTDENARLRGELDRAESDKEAAVESSNAWQSQTESLRQQLISANARITDLQQEKDGAVDAATHWHTIALAHGYEEHPSSDQPDDPDESAAGSQPAAEEPDQVDEPQTRLIDTENGTFRGEQPEAPATGETPRQRRRMTRPERRSRRLGPGSIPQQHRPDEGA